MSDFTVSLVSCKSYDPAECREALLRVLEPLGGLRWVQPGMTVAVKPNLVMRKHPDAAATTHPVLVAELTRLLREAGARVLVGDSPGGIYTPAYLKTVYGGCGYRLVEEAGGELNLDCSQEEISFPQGSVLRRFTYTAWLQKADKIITFAKLKTHGMMGLSGAVKNQFGVVPGTIKPEYHFLYPKTRDFAHMLVDLNEYVRPCLALMDGVVGMEGNGPTGGTPRPVGVLVGAESVHALDLAAAELIGMAPEEIPTLQAAQERGLIPPTWRDLTLTGSLERFRVPDYETIPVRGNESWSEGQGVWKLIKSALRRRPVLKDKSKCVSCGECARICPAHAIVMEDLPKFQYHQCIRCFCCQEFCPQAALTVHRSPIARILNW